VDKNFKANLEKDAYLIKYEGDLQYRQTLLVKSSLNWRYVGVTHEYLHCNDQFNKENFDGITFTHLGDGTNRLSKFTRDIDLLLKGIEDELNNDRYYFYLAQSYKCVGNYDKAIELFIKRISMEGWEEEVYFSLYQIGLCKILRGDDFYNYVGDLMKAHNFRPSRLEAIYHLIKQYQEKQIYRLGYYLGKMALNKPFPDDILFIEKNIYDYLLHDVYSICAYNIGEYDESLKYCDKVLEYTNLPHNIKERVLNNLELTKNKISQV
jgi:tetratricopeptide (TPR) repeat protein